MSSALKSASLVGLAQVTVGELAKSLQLSKSGLFAHFGSKEELQLSILEQASVSFLRDVFHPAVKQPRGEPRIRAIFFNWLAWSSQTETMPGGCVFYQAVAEYDGRPGRVRDYVVTVQREWFAMLRKAAQLAKDEGHFRSDVDPAVFAFEMQGLVMASHHHRLLLATPNWTELQACAFERLVASCRVAAAGPESPSKAGERA